jgi:tripartite-type tricarboxylate transporter receptor subunit TctC
MMEHITFSEHARRAPRRAAVCLALSTLGIALAGPAAADYPEKDITIIVPFSPGGGYDAYARAFAQELEKALDGEVDVVVDNVSGAGGLVGSQQLYNAEPDGYTIGIMNTMGLAVNQVVNEVDYDINNYTWLGQVAVSPDVLAVPVESPHQTLDDLKAAGSLTMAITGFGSVNFVNAILSMTEYGIDITPIPHQGSREAITAAIRGDADATQFNSASIANQVEAGYLRAIVQYTPDKSPALPDVPNGADLGYPQFDMMLNQPRSLAAPPDLPEAVASVLIDAVQEALNSESFREWSDKVGRGIDPAGPQEVAEGIRNNFEFYEQHKETLSRYIGN